MEIIKRGTPPGEKIHEATCNSCKTEVRFKESEGKITYDQRDGNYVTVMCPVCNSLIYKALR